MERRGEERDIGFNPESELKLPLAPIVSTPPDRRGNAAASFRRGSAIFSPSQTLDHRHRHSHNLNPPLVLKEPSPDPDPSTPRAECPSNSRTPTSPPPHPPPPPPEAPSNCVIRYRECLKNHAASMGGHVVDGCGEFMPNGEDGTAEGLRCAACDCHRNFHRKEVDGEAAQPSNLYQFRTPLLTTQTPSAAHHPPQGGFAAAPAIMSFGGDESSSEDLNIFQSGGSGNAALQLGSKKRFRTKFSQEQKDRMQELAEKLEWRIQKQDEQLVQQLCQETGIKREVFKVWMHNNKQAMKKRQI
ncbi:hypothetical protein SASPL_125095 [Salvia splendens]|uniref:ZF-HD dimerization-type domain-containing protein n=1 Tax=Salvia splendens TaxID=180675 RepID=A0A8X8XGI6_SALSN|nr:zinc-finger homeodomain protein 6-like [Salvia splendens]XP_042000130.1 zinc-finger homeodomain protein 6-like [Salvia splendens]KAG6412417.1 hypothetical protein SASPL_125095 [Salvia splendens]